MPFLMIIVIAGAVDVAVITLIKKLLDLDEPRRIDRNLKRFAAAKHPQTAQEDVERRRNIARALFITPGMFIATNAVLLLSLAIELSWSFGVVHLGPRWTDLENFEKGAFILLVVVQALGVCASLGAREVGNREIAKIARKSLEQDHSRWRG